jgi:hypothetical protein
LQRHQASRRLRRIGDPPGSHERDADMLVLTVDSQ